MQARLDGRQQRKIDSPLARWKSKDKPFFCILPNPIRIFPSTLPTSSTASRTWGCMEMWWRRSIGAWGKVLRALKANGLEKKTLVIFTSDHGPWFQGSTGDLRGRKGMVAGN